MDNMRSLIDKDGNGSESFEERRSLLDDSEELSVNRDFPLEPVSVGSSLSAASTGMKNPQDDLEHHTHRPLEIDGGETMEITRSTSDDIPLLQSSQLLASSDPLLASASTLPTGSIKPTMSLKARGKNRGNKSSMVSRRRRRRGRNRSGSTHSEKAKEPPSGPIHKFCSMCLRTLCLDRMVQNTLSCMNVMARIVVWSSVVILAAAVVWYSYELKNNGTDPHLIAWFSAGAFVLLGFPISMGSIVAHLANYNQPHVQCYIVRILWMVPFYSMESWLCLRFHEYAIYIETLRDFYESFVLYSFFQFLIEVLGGEEALILMLKDKSPTRGSHMWGLQWCIKPWLMGQPVRRSDDKDEKDKKIASLPRQRHNKSLKRVHWKSPFFIKCKFGVLQYVLLKFVCSFLAMILETHHIYKEGDFTPKGGYLYICIVTNLSQCWALYCLILFYYATHNELGPIRPVGKFLAVKSLVFFTWYQSVGISILYQMDLIPHYNDSKTTMNLSPEDVAKGIQDYLITLEMLLFSIVHVFVFPVSDFSQQAVQARARALNQSAYNPSVWQQRKRLGRHHHTNQVLRNYHHHRDDKSANSESKSTFTQGDRSFFDLEMTTLSSGGGGAVGAGTLSWEEPAAVDPNGNLVILPVSANRIRSMSADSMGSDLSPFIANAADNNEPAPASAPDWEMAVANVDQQKGHQSSLLPESYAGHQTSSFLQQSLEEGHSTIEEGVEDGSSYWESVDEEDGEEYTSEFSSEGDMSDDAVEESDAESKSTEGEKHGLIRAFLDSAIPRDLRDNTVGIVKGDYVVEKKTLLHHATTSDHYDLFSHARRSRFRNRPGSVSTSEEPDDHEHFK